jgi:DNA-binding NarL/FixJ family response regulator
MEKRKKRILLIDHDNHFKEKITETIDSFEEEIYFKNILEKKQLLNLHKTHRKDNTIALISMSFINSDHILKTLKEDCTEIKIIAVFNKIEESLNGKLSLFDTDSYLTKTDNPTDIKNTIQKVFKDGFYYKETYIKYIKENHDKSVKNNSKNQNSIFTKRELEVLDLICKQKTTQEISEQLFLSPRTIEGHRNSMMLKTGSKNVAGLIVYVFQNDILENIKC